MIVLSKRKVVTILKKRILRVGLVLMLCVLLFAIPVSAAQSYTLDFTISGTYDYAQAQQVLEILNAERAAEGLSAFTLDPVLTEMAMQRAAECSVYYSHTRPDNTQWYSLVQANSQYYYGAYAENIAAGQRSASAVMTAWMNSQGHHDNIMNPEHTSVGLGCFYQNGTISWVQLFHSNVINTGSTPTTAAFKQAIPIKVSSDYLQLHMDGYNDCNVPVYQGCTITPGVYVTNAGFPSASKTYLSGGYHFESPDSSIAVTDGTSVTGIAPGVLDMELHFGDGYFNIPFEVLPRPTLSYRLDGDDLIISCANNYGDAVLYGKEANDELWAYLGVNASTNTYTLYSTNPGEVYTFVVRYYDEAAGWIEVSDRLVVRIPSGAPQPGDLNDDGSVDDADVALLLWHTLFPDNNTIVGNADFNGDGFTDDADVAYLLWHTLFPESYPLA